MKKPKLSPQYKISLSLIIAGVAVFALGLVLPGQAQSLATVIGIGLMLAGLWLISPL